MVEEMLQNFIPPVVAVLGHVDHGKTTLLDAIRKTNIAEREHGGITQKIGASTIEIEHDGIKRRITFIDTPGHAAFSKMRGRGAQAADIGLLIVSSSDGVMPQTRESIKLLQEQKVPFIVVLTKADLPDKNPEKVKQQLLRENVLLEGYGGDVPVIEVSARTGMNIKELLDLVLLVFEMKFGDIARLITEPLSAVVIESRLDQKVGSRVSVVVKSGSLKIKDEIMAGEVAGRVKALMNDQGKSIQSMGIGEAAEILGFEGVPEVGSVVTSKKEIKKKIVVEAAKPKTLADFFKIQEEHKGLSVVLCADTQGSLEAIVSSIPKGVKVVAQKTGEISEADVLMAKSTGAFVLSFNTKIRPDVQRFALLEKVLVKNYTVIYELLDEVKEVLEGKLLAAAEQIFGTAKILASFPFEKTFVMGVNIADGRLAKGDKVRLMRGEEIVGESTITSLRQGKNTVSKIEKGQEAGVIVNPYLDFLVGDVIIAHS